MEKCRCQSNLLVVSQTQSRFTAAHHALQAENMRGALTHKQQPAPQQVAGGAFGLGVDVALGQDPEQEKLPQPESVPLVVGVFNPFVLANGRWIGQMHPIAFLLQPVDNCLWDPFLSNLFKILKSKERPLIRCVD